MSETMKTIARQHHRPRGPTPGRPPTPKATLLLALTTSALPACFYHPTGSEPAAETYASDTSTDATTQVSTSSPESTSSLTDVDTAVCGDGVVEGAEQCDDGDHDDSDSCTNACTLATCGDGVIGPGETCDDHNTVSGDDCSELCALENCGDGVVGPAEQCDDGDADNDDECTTLCRPPACGDGLVTPSAGEECDAGPDGDDDNCFDCKQFECGDGVVEGDETCDDGNTSNDDGCTNACKLAVCGDGFVQSGEQCDDDNNVNDDDCSNMCRLPVCGDSIVHAGEQCDNGPSNGDNKACKLDCQQNICGDGLVLTGLEACDDGNLDNTDECLDTCELSACAALDPNTCPGNTKSELAEAAVDLAIDNLGDNWDDKYNGTLATMLCVPLDFAASALPFVHGMSLTIAMDHTYVGDLTIKIVSPDAKIFTPLSRPGSEPQPLQDNGVSCCGHPANLSAMFPFSFSNTAGTPGKDMGKALGNLLTVCKDENPKLDPCSFKPYPGLAPGKDFDDFKGDSAAGTWQICIGDSGKGDFGKLKYVGLAMARAKYPPK